MNDTLLSQLVGEHVVGVLGTYPPGKADMDVYVCGVDVIDDTGLKLRFSAGHHLLPNQLITLHLDNRSNHTAYDEDLHVHRASFKGLVTRVSEFFVWVEAEQYQVFHGKECEKEYHSLSYQFPSDSREVVHLEHSPLQKVPVPDVLCHENKAGILLTYAQRQPHTTVLAYLSTYDDDIFFVTFPSTFKSELLKRNHQCYFVIDGRAASSVEKATECEYCIIRGEVYEVPRASLLFSHLQQVFVNKNPYEKVFFNHPEVEMYHLISDHLTCPRLC